MICLIAFSWLEIWEFSKKNEEHGVVVHGAFEIFFVGKRLNKLLCKNALRKIFFFIWFKFLLVFWASAFSLTSEVQREEVFLGVRGKLDYL